MVEKLPIADCPEHDVKLLKFIQSDRRKIEMEVFNESGRFLGCVIDESYLWEYDIEVNGNIIIILNTSDFMDDQISMWICN